MPTRISAGVGGHPCFLQYIFIYMIPIDCKITNLSLSNSTVVLFSRDPPKSGVRP